MDRYIGTKIVNAEPEQREGVDGYAVVYVDGYRSWSPKDVFEGAYRKMYEPEAMNFGLAIEALKIGNKVARAGWNGKGMWLGINKESGKFVREECGTEFQYIDYIAMKTVDNKIVPWVASQGDMLADDWHIVA